MTGVTGAPLVPGPMKCETRQCDQAEAEPRHDPCAPEQSAGRMAGWVFSCACGWRRVVPVKVVLVWG